MTPPGSPAAPHHHAHTWDEARQAAIDIASPIPPGPVPLRRALGRRLAADVSAIQDMSHYASSAMDGWAVNGSGPWIPVAPGQRLAPHQASPIVTGGLVPPGAKAVLRSESAETGTDEEGLPVVRLGGAARPGEPRNGQHIRKAGEEATAGELLIRSGTVLNPAQVALAALAGHDELVVQGKALVKLVLTGSEVVDSGLPEPGKVRDTFGPQLAGVVQMMGGIPGETVRIGDSYEEWLGALEDQAGEEPADVVITTGGTGLSDTDHLRRAVAKLGGRLVVDGIAMRPGHPAVLAALPDGRVVLGLPGNPLAAMVALCSIGWPLLRVLGNEEPVAITEVPCGTIMEPQKGFTRVLPFRMVYGMASPAQHTGAGMMRGLASADGIMVVPPHGVQLGEPVRAFPLPWTPELPAPAGEKAKEKAARKPRRNTTAAAAGPVDWSALLG